MPPNNAPQGWQAPTLRREAGQWRIYCDSGVAFVALDKATDELVAACPGRGRGGNKTIMNLFKQQKNGEMNISIEEIKEAAERGHSIDTFILMLEKKALLFSQHRHWFIMKNNRNVCEFCGQLYDFGDSSSCDRLLIEK